MMLFLLIVNCQKEERLIVSIVDPNILTIFQIKKENYTRYFKGEISTRNIEKKELDKIVKNLTPIEKVSNIDTRCLIFYGQDTLAANKFYLQKDKITYEMNDELYNLLWK